MRLCPSLALLGCWLLSASPLAANGPHAGRVTELDASIDATLAQPAYQWRLPREARSADARTDDGVFVSFLKQAVRVMARAVRWVANRLGDIVDWLARRLFRTRSGRARPDRAGGWFDNPQALILIAMIATVAAGVWLGARVLVRRRRIAEPEPSKPASAVDLDDERVTADRLPAEEWLAMAERLEQEGQWRHTLRALFLAALASLGQRGWIRIAPFKSNRDYRRELDPRANADLRAAFAGHTSLFEQAWYGDWPVSPDDVRQGHAWLRRILNDA